MKEIKTRCRWVTDDPLYIQYHDQEWGVPVFDDRALFEFLILEGAQAGLSWITVLKKRENYRECFDHFDAAKIARYTPAKIEKLMQNAGIIRNRLKIETTISNAKAYLAIKEECKSFSDFLWRFVKGRPIQHHWKSHQSVPSRDDISDTLSKALKKRGFKFVGTTICYAFMQAVGMCNDHTIDCFRHRQVAKIKE